MRRRFFLGTLALLCALAFVVPAQAITINGTDFVLFAKTTIKMEDGPTVINGNVGVNDVGGLLRIGAGNTINGIAIADRMFFGSGAKVTDCEFNTSTGGNPSAVCGTQSPAVLPITSWPPSPVPVVPSCVNTNPDVIVPAGGSLALAPGCYGDVDVRDNATLTLSAGTYNFKSLRLQTGSLLDGNSATVNVKGLVVTEPGVTINDVNITTVASGTFEAIIIGNSSTLNNVVLYAPNARMHLHQGGVYTNFEGIAVFITVEPIQIGTVPQGCACIGAIADGGTTIGLSNGCHLNNPANEFFVSTTCAIDAFASCPSASCIAATVQAGATDTTATLNKPAAPAGNYHVIVRSAGGAFCTAATVPIP
jgi:hypothetical protein